MKPGKNDCGNFEQNQEPEPKPYLHGLTLWNCFHVETVDPSSKGIENAEQRRV